MANTSLASTERTGHNLTLRRVSRFQGGANSKVDATCRAVDPHGLHPATDIVIA